MKIGQHCRYLLARAVVVCRYGVVCLLGEVVRCVCRYVQCRCALSVC